MKQYVFIIFSILLVMLLSVPFAMAEVAELRATVAVSDEVVTLGDIFDNLEEKRGLRVADAPLPGKRISLPASYILRLTRQHGIKWRNSRAIKNVIVSREGSIIYHRELKNMIRDEMSSIGLGNTQRDVKFYNDNARIYVPLGYEARDLQVVRVRHNNKNGRFTADISVPSGMNKQRTIRVEGRTVQIAVVPSLARTLLPGDIITAKNIKWTRIPLSQLARNIVREQKKLIGMTPRRPLKIGMPVRQSDIERPQLVKKGKMVNITYTTANMTLTSQGKAIESGGRGDVIRVMNLTSHKTLDAIVRGTGDVEVLTSRGRFAQYNNR